jgi:hypothetical protein
MVKTATLMTFGVNFLWLLYTGHLRSMLVLAHSVIVYDFGHLRSMLVLSHHSGMFSCLLDDDGLFQLRCVKYVF